jgi:hypothetical protein
MTVKFGLTLPNRESCGRTIFVACQGQPAAGRGDNFAGEFAAFDVNPSSSHAARMAVVLPTFRTPFHILENFLLDTHIIDDLPAKQGCRSHRILDLTRMGEQPQNRNHPSMQRSYRRSVSQSTP